MSNGDEESTQQEIETPQATEAVQDGARPAEASQTEHAAPVEGGASSTTEIVDAEGLGNPSADDLSKADADAINNLVFGPAAEEVGEHAAVVDDGAASHAEQEAGEPSESAAIEEIKELYRTVLGMPLELKGMQRAAEYWNTTGPERMGKPTYKALMRYEYGRKFLSWLSGGGPGAAEFSLVMAVVAVKRDTMALIEQDVADMKAAASAAP